MNTQTSATTQSANQSATAADTESAPRTIDSTDLLNVQGVVYIRHQNEVYRLQTTRFGKLILTK